jgi:hypothetical protein
MLQTIEVEIDTSGRIEPLEVLPMLPVGRALLTLLPATQSLPEADRSAAAPASDLPPLCTLFGILKAERPATRDDIKAAIRRRAAERFHCTPEEMLDDEENID